MYDSIHAITMFWCRTCRNHLITVNWWEPFNKCKGDHHWCRWFQNTSPSFDVVWLMSGIDHHMALMFEQGSMIPSWTCIYNPSREIVRKLAEWAETPLMMIKTNLTWHQTYTRKYCVLESRHQWVVSLALVNGLIMTGNQVVPTMFDIKTL